MRKKLSERRLVLMWLMLESEILLRILEEVGSILYKLPSSFQNEGKERERVGKRFNQHCDQYTVRRFWKLCVEFK